MPSRRAAIALLVALGLLLLTLALPAAGSAASPSPAATAAATAPASNGTTATGPAPAEGATPTPFATPREPACPNPTPTTEPSPSPGHTPAPTAHPNLCAATPNGADPTSLLAFLFTPIFQAIFIVMAVAYNLIGDIGLAIIVVTLLVRLIISPLFRKQLLSQRRMQLLQPELAARKARYKGDRTRQNQEQMKFYQERGINPAAGCLPTLVGYMLLLPMYYVFSAGLLAPDITSMLTVLGHQLIHIDCQDAANALVPCIQTHVAWLGGLDASKPEILVPIPGTTFGLSGLAIVAALLQLVQTRMMLPVSAEASAGSMRTASYIGPFISLVYGAFLPAGLFIYWIVSTLFMIVQQYLTVGWGPFFPLLGWTPAFAMNHKPRFGVQDHVLLPPKASGSGQASGTAPLRRDPATSAAGTVRQGRKRGSSSRRGRRR
ncbi:MAG TPA: membrane protein insertase YidC [Candidatus Limnocylindrales bacterium]|nr:membrane protein insertase YidC [Candidatus Limnocylindrales bacterium]